MHIPDGFINASTSLGAAAVSLGGLGTALRWGTRTLRERQIPLAGLASAFVFVLQMLNFPVAAGTSGHVLGGALVAILLGPALGITVMAVVVIVQALLFADGGVSALGLNIFNMALITTVVGWLVFISLMRILPKRASVVPVAAMLAGWASVVAASIGFVVQYEIGGQGGVDIGTVLGAMVGVHALIGIGEGIITAAVVGAVLRVRPDLVNATHRYVLTPVGAAMAGRRATTAFVAAGLAVAITLVVFVAPLASSAPDGLERVAADLGLAAPSEDPGLGASSDQRTDAVVTGVVGMVVAFATGTVLVAGVRRRRSSRAAAHR